MRLIALAATWMLASTGCTPITDDVPNDSGTTQKLLVGVSILHDGHLVKCDDGQMVIDHLGERHRIQSLAFYAHEFELTSANKSELFSGMQDSSADLSQAHKASQTPKASEKLKASTPLKASKPLQALDDQWHSHGISLISADANCTDNNLQFNQTLAFLLNEPASELIGLSEKYHLSFKLGVPFARNHSNPLVQSSPMNISSMFWSWRTGYKFLRMDTASEIGGFAFHLGSVGCQSASSVRAPNTECETSNVLPISVALSGIEKKGQDYHINLALDLSALLGTNRLTKDASCMFMGISQQAQCSALMKPIIDQQVFKEW